MSVKNSDESPTKMGRPGLSEEQKTAIWRELSVLKPRSLEYRTARRKIATDFDRTESLIDKIFRDQLKAFIAANSSRANASLPEAL